MGSGGERGEVEACRLAYLVEDGCELLEEVLHVQETGLKLLNIAGGGVWLSTRDGGGRGGR